MERTSVSINYLMKFPFIPIVAGLIVKNGDILIGKRSINDLGGGLWEFPGGKIEFGEDRKSALIRELKEELGIDAVIDRKLMHYKHKHNLIVYDLNFYLVKSYSGDLKTNAHDEIKWVKPKKILNYTFIGGDNNIINAIINEKIKL